MRRERILIDSNLRLLLVIGMAGFERFAHHKRLKHFDLPSDFDILSTVLASAAEVILTPHTLTETSNLLRQIGNPARAELSLVLSEFIKAGNEVHVASKEGAAHGGFISLGLTDSILLHLAADHSNGHQALLLTMDFDLYMAASGRRMRVMNFNELRGF